MPTYEFRCLDGTIIERVFKMSDAPQAIPAPDGSGMAVRIISGGADLIFKGSGFYITDYGKDGKKDQRETANKAGATGDNAKGERARAEASASNDAGSGTGNAEKNAEKSTEKSAEKRAEKNADKGADKGAEKRAAAGDAKRDSSKAARSSGSGPASPPSSAAA